MKTLKLIGYFIAVTSILSLNACQQRAEDDSDLSQLQVDAHLEVAGLYQQQGQYRAAEIEAMNALRIKPNGSDVRSFLAGLYYEIGDLNNAKNFISSLYAADPQNTEVALILAELEYRSGATFRAESILSRLDNLTAAEEREQQLIQGSIYAVREDFNAARDEFELALQSDPNFIDGLIAASRLELAIGNRALSQTYLDRATEASPSDLDVLIWKGQFSMLTGQYAEAEEALFEAYDATAEFDTMTSRSFSVLQSIRAVLQAQQKNQEALRFAELIAASPQGQYLASFEQALAYYNQGEFQEAEAAILGLFTISPNDVNSQVLMGLTQFAQQDYEAASAVLNSLVDSDTATPQAIKTLAAVYLRQNQAASAISTLSSALENYPEDATLIAMLGMAHQTAGDYERSIQYLQDSLALVPDDIRSLYTLAQTYYLQLDFASAIEPLKTILELDPSFIGAKSSLVGIYLLEENFTEARIQVQEWLDREPRSTVNTVLAGWVAFTEENYPEARRLFESTLQVDPQNVQARLFLARIHLLSENFAAAVDQYKSLLEVEPANIEGLSGLLAAGSLGGTVQESVDLVSEIAENNPDNFVAPLLLSQYQLRQNNLQDSLSWAELAWTRQPNDTTRENLSNNYAAIVTASRDNGLRTAVTDVLDNAAFTEEEILTSLANLVDRAVQEENLQEAQRIAKIMQQNYPDSARGYVAEGDAQSEIGDSNLALEAFLAAWEIERSSGIGARIHIALTGLNRPGDARQFLDDWISEFPEDGAANLLAGIDSLNNNNESQAIEQFEIAYRQQPTNPIVLNNLAWLYRTSQIEKGIELARQAVQYREDYADALDTLGWLLHLNDENEEAVKYLQQALDLAPDSQAIADHVETVLQVL